MQSSTFLSGPLPKKENAFSTEGEKLRNAGAEHTVCLLPFLNANHYKRVSLSVCRGNISDNCLLVE